MGTFMLGQLTNGFLTGMGDMTGIMDRHKAAQREQTTFDQGQEARNKTMAATDQANSSAGGSGGGGISSPSGAPADGNGGGGVATPAPVTQTALPDLSPPTYTAAPGPQSQAIPIPAQTITQQPAAAQAPSPLVLPSASQPAPSYLPTAALPVQQNYPPTQQSSAMPYRGAPPNLAGNGVQQQGI